MNEDHTKPFYDSLLKNKSNNLNQNIIQDNSNQSVFENLNQSVSENLNQKDNSKKSRKPKKPKQIIIQDSEENVPENSNQNIIQENSNQNVLEENSNQNIIKDSDDKQSLSKGLSKQSSLRGLSKQSSSGGLDLDEIHNLNIMNNIISCLNNINETLKGIKDQISKQNPQKLGRFKVEKYNPNMSITEFKKLFSKLDWAELLKEVDTK